MSGGEEGSVSGGEGIEVRVSERECEEQVADEEEDYALGDRAAEPVSAKQR